MRLRLVLPIALAAPLALAGGLLFALRSQGAHAAPLPAARHDGLQVLAFSEAHPTAPARGALSAHLDALSAVAPAWLTLAGGGTVRYETGDPFTASLGARGAAVVPVLRDPGGHAGALLADGPLRRRLCLRLAVMLRALRAHGVVLDLGALPPSARHRYPTFVRELRKQLGAGLPIYVTVPAVTDRASARASAGYDLRDLARPALLVLRDWNEHSGATRPGPVASLAFWKQALRRTLADAPRARVLVGVPTWGWRFGGDGDAGRATQAELYPEAGHAALADPDGARIVDADGTAWVESDRSVQLKLEVARAAKVAGVALWVRGGESSRLWTEPLIDPASSSR